MRPWQIGALLAAGLAACSVSGTVGVEGSAGGAGATRTEGTGGSTGSTGFDKVDVVLSIDNAKAMADKQQILALAVSDLMQAFYNPPCVDGSGQPVSGQPAGPSDDCPSGSARVMASIQDVHIGVVTSSIGGHGSDACSSIEIGSCPGGAINGSADDHGHLVTRAGPCGSTELPTYQDEGFLAWDPQQVDAPPGATNLNNFTPELQSLVLGAGEIGCGLGSQLESWYRFLVDPDPYLSIGVAGGQVARSGIDATLLAERQDFLRPDSLLVILMLSDADDCSIIESGQNYLVAQIDDPSNPGQPYHLPRPRAECATNPQDPCCRPCTADQTGCPTDPLCASSPTLDAQSDPYSLRCWDQKRRFGVDFLYPTSRYVTGLTALLVPDQGGEMVPNPIFTNLDAFSTAAVRDPTMVILGGVVGVPWQDVARDPGDLTRGFQSADELTAGDGGPGNWATILGDPSNDAGPLDPHMIEATAPRTGADPVTGTSLAPPNSPSGTDPISGHEYSQVTPVDLEYACIFPLLAERDCTDTSLTSCDCTDPQNDNPLCEPDPSKNNQRTLQLRAKAYPGLRQLQVLHDLGTQAVVSSICPAQQELPTSLDFGYRPAIRALVERMSRRAHAPSH